MHPQVCGTGLQVGPRCTLWSPLRVILRLQEDRRVHRKHSECERLCFPYLIELKSIDLEKALT